MEIIRDSQAGAGLIREDRPKEDAMNWIRSLYYGSLLESRKAGLI